MPAPSLPEVTVPIGPNNADVPAMSRPSQPPGLEPVPDSPPRISAPTQGPIPRIDSPPATRRDEPSHFGAPQVPQERIDSPPAPEARVRPADVYEPPLPAIANGRGPTLQRLREESHIVARQGLPHRAGQNHPRHGGLDASGAVQYVLSQAGYPEVPRSIIGQFNWLRQSNRFRQFQVRPGVDEIVAHLSPGNLIFWGDIRTGQVSHVMLYLGYDMRQGLHYAFGTRGGYETGIHGHGVDVFPLKLDRERIIAIGAIPGLRNP